MAAAALSLLGLNAGGPWRLAHALSDDHRPVEAE